MQRGPAGAVVGTASCPFCNAPMVVKNNKHGFPAGWCTTCRTQFQSRSNEGSALLLGRVHTWADPDVAKVMVTDAAELKPSRPMVAGQLPPHLAQPSTTPKSTPKPSATLPKSSERTQPAKRKSLWDLEL